MVKILGSILSANFGALQTDIDAITQAGVDGLHLDVMDGNFVPNISFGLPVINKIETDLPLDFHLMIRNPETFVRHLIDEDCKFRRSQFKHSVTLHAEASAEIDDDLEMLRAYGYSPRIAINPATPVTALEKFLPLVDGVLIMSVNPGFAGQKFIEGVLSKVAYIKEQNPKILVGLDGGVNDKSLPLIAKTECDYLISASYLFNSNNYAVAIDSLRF